MFLASLGLTKTDAGLLRRHLEIAARTQEAVAQASDEFGERYIVDFQCVHAGRVAVVRSTWILLHAEDFPRLTSCFVL